MRRCKLTKRIIAVVLAFVFVISNFVISEPTVHVKAAETKLVAFTFDDGPGSYGTTMRLLDGLEARGAKATFFMTGANGPHGVVYNTNILNRMVDDGHQLANHTYSHHTPFSNLSVGTMISEVSAVDDYIYDAMGGKFQTLVRIPGGDKSDRISSTVDAPMIRWSVDPLDWKYQNASTVYRSIMGAVRDGSIVLVHDIYDSSVSGALQAISDLQNQGYECVTVSELYRRRGITLENGETYSGPGVTGVNLSGYEAPEIVQTVDNYANNKISVKNPNSGTTLRYTINGTMPDLSSPVWKDGLEIADNTTITIAGFDKFGTRTPETRFTYVKGNYYGVFDAIYYANRYLDLRKTFGYDANALWNHYIKCGIYEGRQGSAIFSINDYKDMYPDLKKAFGNDNIKYLWHFSKYGMKEGRSGVSDFDVKSYKNQYADLRQAYGNDNEAYYIHYMKYGYKENRVTSGCEDVVGATTVYQGVDFKDVYNYVYYVNKYLDIRRAFGTDDKAVLKHFVTYGMNEGRQGSAEFDVKAYKNRYKDLKAAYGNNNAKYYWHYINSGKKEGRNGKPGKVSKPTTTWNGVDYSAVYDYNDYISKNKDVKKAFGTDDVSVLRHFVIYGMKEGRQAKSTFDVVSYQNAYSDLRKAFGTDKKKYYIHYMNYGYKENRTAVGVKKMKGYQTILNGIDYSRVYDYNFYISKYPDVKKAFGGDEKAVLEHFVNYGMKEFRQGKKTFNPRVYKKYNADLQKAYKNDNVAYYWHYLKWGFKEKSRRTY